MTTKNVLKTIAISSTFGLFLFAGSDDVRDVKKLNGRCKVLGELKFLMLANPELDLLIA